MALLKYNFLTIKTVHLKYTKQDCITQENNTPSFRMLS